MIKWRTIKRFPQMALVGGVLVISTVLFAFWWMNRPKPALASVPQPADEIVEQPKPAPFKPYEVNRLLVADGDLIDIETGEVLAKKWLKGEAPGRLWYDERTGKIIGKHERGIVRYHPDGTKDAEILSINGVAISEDLSMALYAKEKDIWKAGIDWEAFKLVDEKRVTSQGNIMDRYFLQNVQLATNKVVVAQNMNQFLRVNLVTGEVTLTRIPMSEVGERRSPDGAILLGEVTERQAPKVFAYDVEADDAKFFDLPGRFRATEFAWLSKDKAAFLIVGKEVWTYDRASNEIAKVMDLPMHIAQMAKPSPTGRFVFCLGQQGALIADLEKKEIQPINAPAQSYEWIGEDRLILSREVPDTNLRGTWTFQLGTDSPIRVSTEPYYVARNSSGSVLYMKEAGAVIFSTRTGIFKLKPDADTPVQVLGTEKPSVRLQKVDKWPY